MGNQNKGAEPKKTEKKIIVAGVGAELKEKEKPKVIKLPEPKIPVLSLEDKILKVHKMGELVSKRKKLNEAIMKLDSFELADDSLNTTLTIEDGERYDSKKFLTTNSLIIDNVAELLKEKVFKQIEKVEKEIEALV